MTITFNALPKNLTELQALPIASLNEPEYGAALFVAAMMHYSENKEETFEMLDFLNGPYEVTEFQKQFIADIDRKIIIILNIPRFCTAGNINSFRHDHFQKFISHFVPAFVRYV